MRLQYHKTIISVCILAGVICIFSMGCASTPQLKIIKLIDAGNYKVALIDHKDLNALSDDRIAEYMIRSHIAFVGVNNGTIDEDGLYPELIELIKE